MYHTNRKTNRTEMPWPGKDFRDFENADSKISCYDIKGLGNKPTKSMAVGSFMA